jgi:hypothetical protein
MEEMVNLEHGGKDEYNWKLSSFFGGVLQLTGHRLPRGP